MQMPAGGTGHYTFDSNREVLWPSLREMILIKRKVSQPILYSKELEMKPRQLVSNKLKLINDNDSLKRYLEDDGV
ncbi:hypothetical protein TNIN_292211 [Trichonephila inaurata madagascariensis]|uniref:Uncharacterized protein n=1 Tax=Trichonephila inaurata madagascariensis TaxID=2747483 RepID=A0A8X6ISL2_9ARAC|nr:hypothetical protein TNIN_292211 [Trichonephila inaurata madagascariensis]